MHVILTGATGLIGSAVLHHLLSLSATSAATQKINKVTVISRRANIPLLQHPDRPRQNTHTKIEVLEHKDFLDYEKLGLLSRLRELGDSDGKIGVIWALGVSQSLVSSEEQYDTITRQYPIEAAKVISRDLGADQVNFIYVSGEGATQKPGMLTPMFGRIKGRTETELIALMQTEPFGRNLKVLNARPGGVDSGAETEQRLVHKLASVNDGGTGGRTRSSILARVAEGSFYRLFRAGMFTSVHSPTGELARALVELATGDGNSVEYEGAQADGRILPNIVLKKVARITA